MANWDEPFEELKRMQKRIQFLMQRMWEPVEEEMRALGSFPVDVSETEDEVIIKADLPGFSKEEVSVKLTDSSVEISAEHKEKKVVQSEKMFRSERRMGAFKRFSSLPTRVSYEKADAKFENGVLTIVVPKKEKKKTAKAIKIK